MKVSKLIELLENVKNKDLEVFIYYDGNQELTEGNIAHISSIDYDLTDRVDINCTDLGA